MPNTRLPLPAVLLAALLAPAAARAGVFIEAKEQEGKTQRILMDGQKMRMETGADGDAMIFDGAAKKTIQLDADEKVYTEFTKDDMAKMNAMVKQSGGKKDDKPITVKYEKTGKSDKAIGQSCDVYRVVRSDSQDKDEMCLAPFGTFGIDKSDFAAFRAFGDFASEMLGGGELKGWTDLPGIPLISWDASDGERKEDFRATKVEKRSIPASAFTVPAGFKKGPSFAEQMKQMEEMKVQMEQQMQQKQPKQQQKK